MSSQEITTVVQGLVKEFIVPKYPIYRVQYVVTKLVCETPETYAHMRSKVQTHLFEIKGEVDNFYKSFTLTPSTIETLEDGEPLTIERCNKH